MFSKEVRKALTNSAAKSISKTLPAFSPYITTHRLFSTHTSPLLLQSPRPRLPTSPQQFCLKSAPFALSRRGFQVPDPQNINPNVKLSPEERMNQFIGKSDPSALRRVDQAARETMGQARDSQRLNKSGSSGSFYMISRLVFAFEAWTLLFFGGVLGYYLYNILQYRDDSPTEVAMRIWENFSANSQQYRDVITGKTDLKNFREEFLKDELTLRPNNAKAVEELDEIQRAKRQKQNEQKKRQEAAAQAEWDSFHQEIQVDQNKADLDDMQRAFEKKLKEFQSSGKQVTEQDLLDFISEHNAQKAVLEAGTSLPRDNRSEIQRKRFE